jgi:hypothetical protein
LLYIAKKPVETKVSKKEQKKKEMEDLEKYLNEIGA